MSELLIFIGQTAQDLDKHPKHGDYLVINEDGFSWGDQEKERGLVVRVPDMTKEEIDEALSSDYIVETADVNAQALNPEFLIPSEKGIARYRSKSFDFSSLPIDKRNIVDDCRDNLSHEDFNLYTKLVSCKTELLSKTVESKAALDDSGLLPGEQFLSARNLGVPE